jgi:hypothetical protein
MRSSEKVDGLAPAATGVLQNQQFAALAAIVTVMMVVVPVMVVAV